MNIRVDTAFGRRFNKLMYLVEDDSLYIMLLVFLSMHYGLTTKGLWCRLIRIIVLTPTYLLAFPRLSILLSSITRAFNSIAVTVVLFMYLILVYTLFGHLIFKVNDPYHFGTYGLSMWSFFHFALFDNWSEMWYINYGGCDSFPSELVMNVVNPEPVTVIKTSYGSFKYPSCDNPKVFPVASTVIFISFTFICGYICVNMILAAVVIGVKNSLDEFKHVEMGGADTANDEHGSISALDTTISLHKSKSSTSSLTDTKGKDTHAKRASVLTAKAKEVEHTAETEKWKQLLESIWNGSTLGSSKSSYWDIVKEAGPWYSLRRIRLEFNRWLGSSIHGGVYIIGCLAVMVLEV